MKPLRLLVIVAALVAAVFECPHAIAYDFHVTAEDIEIGQKHQIEDEDIRIAQNRDSESSTVGWNDLVDYVNEFRKQFGWFGYASGRQAVLSVLIAGVLAAVGIVFMWWGVRKVVSMLLGAAWDGRFGSRIEARTK